MKREIIIPKSEEHWLELRADTIASTDCSAILNLSPYDTLFQVWHRKKNKEIVKMEPNERMKWGTRLEEPVAYGIAEDHGFEIRRMGEYIRVPELKIGSSFDFAIGDDGILEIKNVDALAFQKGWIVDDDFVEAPPHIEIQVQHQLFVSGRKYAYIGALIGGNKVVLTKREPNAKIFTKIQEEIKKFWESIEANKPPPPDFKKDAKFIAQLYAYAEPNKVMHLNGENRISSLAEEYRMVSEASKVANIRKEGVKAKLLMAIGDNEKVIGDRFTISAGMIGPAHIEFDRKAYRSFKVSWRKEDAKAN